MVKPPNSLNAADLSELEQKIGHKFQNPAILELALTHSSSTVQPLTDNERLEFLGDAVLALSVNEHLYRTLPEEGEGELTRIKSAAVSTTTLARVSRALGLAQYMRLGKGLGDRGGLPDSVHANVTEAIFAAIYLDAGLDPAKRLVIRLLAPEIAQLTTSGGSENAKSQLQELSQRRFGCAPRYRLVRESGPQHDKIFEIAVEIRGRIFEAFSAHTKKEAEQGAARQALAMLSAEAAKAAAPKPAPVAPAAAAPLPQGAPVPAASAQQGAQPVPAGKPKRTHRGTRGKRKPSAQKAAAVAAAAGLLPPAEKPKAKASAKGSRQGKAAKPQSAASETQSAPVRRQKKITKNPYDLLGLIPK